MIKLHFIIHESFEGPGILDSWATSKGYQISYSKLYEGDKLPFSSTNIDMLIVMGGPQSPNTTVHECSHFDAKAEMTLINNFINDNKIVLGICLGAQMIGQALGAKVLASPNTEIGVFPITKTKKGKENNLFKHFPNKIDVGHWHGDMANVTETAEIIASSEGCPNQIIKYDEFVYGFQCHLEFTPESIESIISHSERELKLLKNKPYVQDPEKIRSYNFEKMNSILTTFIENLVDQYVSESVVV